MSREKHKTFSSAREIFKTYLPRNAQEEEMNSGYDQVENRRTSELLEEFKSNLEKQTRQ